MVPKCPPAQGEKCCAYSLLSIILVALHSAYPDIVHKAVKRITAILNHSLFNFGFTKRDRYQKRKAARCGTCYAASAVFSSTQFPEGVGSGSQLLVAVFLVVTYFHFGMETTGYIVE